MWKYGVSLPDYQRCSLFWWVTGEHTVIYIKTVIMLVLREWSTHWKIFLSNKTPISSQHDRSVRNSVLCLYLQSIQRTTCETAANLVSFHHEGAVYYKTCKVRADFPHRFQLSTRHFWFGAIESSLTLVFVFQEVKCDEELVLLVESSVSLQMKHWFLNVVHIPNLF